MKCKYNPVAFPFCFFRYYFLMIGCLITGRFDRARRHGRHMIGLYVLDTLYWMERE